VSQPPPADEPGLARPDANRDEVSRALLFGLLALQNGLVDRQSLLDALASWLADRGGQLGDRLVGRGAVSSTMRDVLAVMVDAHISHHGGSPERSLAALSSLGSIREDLARLADPGLDASLSAAVSDLTAPYGDPDPPGEAPGAGLPIGAGRFRILRFHDRGGLGEVYLARDEEVRREIALKQIRQDFADHPQGRARFLLEAEITGGLEHPGIVPVYGLGSHPDGRPFYAMRFIKGDSLKQAIARFHDGPGAAADVGARTTALFELLRRFLDVCNAVAYAHSRGVLHRDLKPGNVMLGPFGETLVVDWGLAKATGRPDPALGAGIEPLRPEAGSDLKGTAAGSIVGTPGFMSPEQALGDLDSLGPGSDVYSLGATLYTLLTGRPPFGDSDPKTFMDRLLRGDFPTPRSVRPWIAPALESICLKAMAFRPEDRYQSPRTLAEDLERWLVDEPVSAYREPRSARFRRWTRRHQRVVSGASAAVLVALIALAALVAVVSESNRELGEANALISEQNDRLERTNTDLELARLDAIDQRDRAEGVTAFLVEGFRSPDPTRDGRSVTVAEVLDRAVESLPDRVDVSPAARAAILDAIGATYRGLGLVGESVDASQSAFEIGSEALGDSHPSTLQLRNNLALAHRDAGRLDLALPMLRETLQARRHLLGDDHPDTLHSRNNLGDALLADGRVGEALPLLESTHQARGARLGDDHPDTLQSRSNLAAAYWLAGRRSEAIPLYESTLASRRRILGDEHPDTIRTLIDLGEVDRALGRFAEAIPLYRRLLEVHRESLGEEHPDTLHSMNNLASTLLGAGNREEALPLLEETLELRAAVLDPEHPDVLASKNNLAAAYQQSGRLGDAIPLFESAREAMLDTVGPDHPDALQLDHNLASAYWASFRRAEALALFESTLERRRLVEGEDHPNTLETRNNLAFCYTALGRHEEAIPLYERAVDPMLAALGEDHQRSIDLRFNLIRAYQAASRPADAARIFRDLLAWSEGLAPRDEAMHAGILAGLGQELNRLEQFEEAERVLRLGLEIRENLIPDSWLTPNARSMLGEALVGLGRFQEAEPLLILGRRGLVGRRGTILPARRAEVLRDAVDRLVKLYERWGIPGQAEAWRQIRPDRPGTPAERALPADVFARSG
jgi:serine/threonine protein kinase/tetratricopeptide (TPR) repeat protein